MNPIPDGLPRAPRDAARPPSAADRPPAHGADPLVEPCAFCRPDTEPGIDLA